MGFKTDTSFLRFLTMGALGVRQTLKQLRAAGFEPIELERYCGSNKIWMTKVKRLRLPDILCVRTGLRVEVRAKSDLKIRMSDAPNNPDRTWDAGNRDDDFVALIAMREEAQGLRAADEAVFFDVGALRRSVETSKLGPPKSASEGAERDRVWPAVIPSRDGTVRSVSADKLVVEMHNDGSPSRMQTYTLKGKHVYVQPGQRFVGEASILAGTPAALADLNAYRNRTYNPLAVLKAPNAVDRYSAVKAIPYREDLRDQAVPSLEALLKSEQEERVALEAAGSAAVMGSQLGQQRIEAIVWGNGLPELRMEAVLILTELGSPFAKHELMRVASDPRFAGDEIRQAAIWGLGKSGLRTYDELRQFIDDSDDNAAMHAIMAFGSDTPPDVVALLVGDLSSPNARRKAAASEVLRVIGNETAVRALAAVAQEENNWVIATLGRLPPALVRECLQGSEVLAKVEPLLLLNQGVNWLASENRLMDLAFLSKQDVEAH